MAADKPIKLRNSLRSKDRDRLEACARVVDNSAWAEVTGVTHFFEATDRAAAPWYGAGTEVYFDAARRVARGNRVVFLHRRQRRAVLVSFLIKRDGDGWIVGRSKRENRSRMSAENWAGPYPARAFMLPIAKRLRKRAR